MGKPFAEWTVLPHGQLWQIDDNVLTVAGDLPMPLGDFPRRMTVVQLADARLVIFSAIALHEDEMQRLETFGRPAFLIVPNDIHRMDAKTWKDRYPDIVVIAPAGARDKVKEVVPVDATTMDFADPRARLFTVPGTDEHELALVVETATGTTLIVNDLIWNVPDRPGLGGWIYNAIGATGSEPKMPKMVRMREVKDKTALAAQLEAWAHLPKLNRIIVSHGDVITRDASKVLTDLAHRLAA